ncbi:MAG: fibrobacter succinogenes major paralogous domain-containing protein [Bacteroidetes bacterium]|nr:fibrobacter succinogenes major paralogous domain-containing protein [Bacteroidota bacterium]
MNHLAACITGLLFFCLISCSKKDDTPAVSSVSIPVLTTDSVTMIIHNAANCGGTITSDGGAAITRRGVCWTKTPLPLLTDDHTEDGTGTGTYTSRLTGLDTNTLYYVRAYASNSKGTAYGNTMSFKTLRIVNYGVATDIDGNIYPVVKIGGQFWLSKNLRVTHYRNGDAIPHVTGDNQWKVLITGAYCVYDNVQVNDTTYGNMYNWYAATDSRGICPEGWHIPSNDEWNSLGAFLGGSGIAGGMLKSTGTLEQGTGLWYAPNTGATNSTGFTGLPGGTRFNYGSFYSIGNLGNFWSSSDSSSVNAWNYILDANNGELVRTYNFKTFGFSLRCCKD